MVNEILENVVEGHYLQIIGCTVKNDNGIYIVTKKYSDRNFCLHRCKSDGAESKGKYNIFFLDDRAFSRNPNMKVDIITKEQLPEAQKNVKHYVQETTAKETVYTFVPGTPQSKYLRVLKSFYITNRQNSIYNCIYEIVGECKERYELHLIGKRRIRISYNINNTYQGLPIILSLSKSAIEKLIKERNIEYADRIESRKGDIN